jgi:hypothetical protein
MLRCPLDEMILTIRILDLGDVEDFLASAVNPPNAVSILSSLECLRSLQVGVGVVVACRCRCSVSPSCSVAAGH